MHFYFIGVTTSQSAMVKIFPQWSKALNLDLDFVGIDLPLVASADQYREAVTRIKDNDLAIGSVLTTHKTKIYEHAHALFDKFDALASVTLQDILDDDYWLNSPGEVSSRENTNRSLQCERFQGRCKFRRLPGRLRLLHPASLD